MPISVAPSTSSLALLLSLQTTAVPYFLRVTLSNLQLRHRSGEHTGERMVLCARVLPPRTVLPHSVARQVARQVGRNFLSRYYQKRIRNKETRVKHVFQFIDVIN